MNSSGRALALLVAGLGALALSAVFSASAWAPVGCTSSGCMFTERTPSGFVMRVEDPTGSNWSMVLGCPGPDEGGNGHSLGVGRFEPPSLHRPFTVKGRSGWKFRGSFDSRQHFRGSGTIPPKVCGPGVPTHFSEPVPREAEWLACPTGDANNPEPPNTPLSFTGVLPGAALGTSVRIEYTDPDPNVITDVDVVKTDAAGNFSDVHSFPAAGFVYGADAVARYPNDPLAPGPSCGFAIGS